MRPLMTVGYGALFAPLVVLTVILAGCSSAAPDIELTATDRMKDYLLANYDASLSLVRESPNANSHVY